jgi:hypothetical protein
LLKNQITFFNDTIKTPYTLDTTKTIKISTYNNGEHPLTVCPEIINAIFELISDNTEYKISCQLDLYMNDILQRLISDDLVINKNISPNLLINFLNNELYTLENDLSYIDFDTEGKEIYLNITKIINYSHPLYLMIL